MKILVVLPDVTYFLWQMLVQIHNLRKFGYEQDTIYLIGKHNIQKSDILNKIITYGGLKCKFYVFNDEREYPKYSSSMRPHILAKFFEKYPEMSNETFFYIDPDVLFTKKLNFDEYLNDNIWYLSDTCSYIDSKYIKSKSEQLFNEMCDIVKVSPEEVTANDDNAGGAQYLMKGVNAEFWTKNYNDMEKLYCHMKDTESIYHPEHPIQSWTADMWSVFWNGLYFGHKIKINTDLEFCWATDNIKRWDETYIFHNAGVVGDSKEYFSKIMYQVSPFNKDIERNIDNCTYKYVQEIKETEENFKEILW